MENNTALVKDKKEIRYRHEWKHEITWSDLIAIRQRLRAVAEPDPHAVDGKYLIRSLYFDNLNDKALREKVDGVNRREKFRIRYYNGDPSAVIHLEKKSKLNGLGTKYSAPLTVEEAQKIVDGDIDWMLASPHSLIQELSDGAGMHGFPQSRLRDRSGGRRRDHPGGEMGQLPAVDHQGLGADARQKGLRVLQIRAVQDLRLTCEDGKTA